MFALIDIDAKEEEEGANADEEAAALLFTLVAVVLPFLASPPDPDDRIFEFSFSQCIGTRAPSPAARSDDTIATSLSRSHCWRRDNCCWGMLPVGMEGISDSVDELALVDGPPLRFLW